MPVLKYVWYELGDFYQVGSGREQLFTNWTTGEMMSYKVGEETNLDRIYKNFSIQNREDFKEAYIQVKSIIDTGNIELIKKIIWGPLNTLWPKGDEYNFSYSWGTVIAVPKDKLNRAIAARDGGNKQLASKRSDLPYFNTRVFFAKELEDQITSDWYQQKYTTNSEKGGIKKEVPKVTVKIWSRALTLQNTSSTELQGKWIDVSKYIEVINTSTSDNGGNFSFTLAPIRASYDSVTNFWDADRELIYESSLSDNTVVVKTSTFKRSTNGEKVRSDFLFNLALQQNDVVWISFTPLLRGQRRREREKERDYSQVSDGIFSQEPTTKPGDDGRIYDMCGLIDVVEQSFDSNNNSLTINVTGRDLSKLVIEDGSYMYTSLWDGHNFFLDKQNGIISRNLGAGARMVYNFFSEPRYRTIAEAVKFIINIASYIKIAPGTEMVGDSEGTKKEYKWSDIVDGEEVEQTTIKNDYNGIWRSVKLAFDSKIETRKLADISLGSPDGSLLDLMRNYTQSPWVELIMDTYGEHFYFTFRQPPHNKKSIQEYINSDYFKKWSYIEEIDVLRDSLSFDTRSYSLYQLDYKQATWGGAETLATVVPTIPLPDYAEVFGNKQWRMSSNLLPFEGTDDIQSVANQSYIRSKGIEDLVWVVETTCYLPFTRRGTITINGDRRFKKGMWFHYRPTNEIFYIVGVSHLQSYQGQVERTTTLTVERGMVLDFVKGGVRVRDSFSEEIYEPNYFNIVNTEKIESYLKSETNSFTQTSKVETATNSDTLGDNLFPTTPSFGGKQPQERVRSNFEINKKIFNFFLRRSQFSRDTTEWSKSFSTTPDFGKNPDITNIV